MKLIDDPKTLAERIVNAVCDDLYSRSGGEYFFDAAFDSGTVADELIPDLILVVEGELARRTGEKDKDGIGGSSEFLNEVIQ